MTRWAPWLLLCLPGGCVLAALVMWQRHREREQRPDLVLRWRAFLEGEPKIPPARVPPVKPLTAVRQGPALTRWQIDQLKRSKVRSWR